MTNFDKLYYKTCREQANLTQEQAAVLLGIESTTLSRYENGRIPVSQDLVAAMIKVYHTPTLAKWHVEYVNPALVPYLRIADKPLTDGDAMLLLELADDSISQERNVLKTIFGNWKVSTNKADKLNTSINTLQNTANKILSAIAYLESRDAVEEQ